MVGLAKAAGTTILKIAIKVAKTDGIKTAEIALTTEKSAGNITGDVVKSGVGKTPSTWDASIWRNADGKWKYPGNDGFAAPPVNVELPVGTRIDRYGRETGSYVSPQGTPFEQRSLPPTSINDQYRVYEVVKPLPVQSGKVAPWFEQPGGGTQFKMPYSIKKLLKDGYIRDVTP